MRISVIMMCFSSFKMMQKVQCDLFSFTKTIDSLVVTVNYIIFLPLFKMSPVMGHTVISTPFLYVSEIYKSETAQKPKQIFIFLKRK